MASFFNKFRNSFGRGSSKQTVNNDNQLHPPKLTIQRRPTRSNTQLASGATHSETFHGIVHDAVTAQTLSLAQIPLQHETTEIEEIVTLPQTLHQVIPDQVTQPLMNNAQVVPVEVHRPDTGTPAQPRRQRLYPTLPTDEIEQVVTPVQQLFSSPQQSQSSPTGDTTNPRSDLPDRLLADEHYVVDVATQHDTSTVSTLCPHPKAK